MAVCSVQRTKQKCLIELKAQACIREKFHLGRKLELLNYYMALMETSQLRGNALYYELKC